VTPGSLEYAIGRPFVDRATLRLPNGKTFTIIADQQDAAHPYVGTVLLNGAPLARSYIRHGEIMAGGMLEFRMAAKANRTWATAKRARPFSTTY
jgi:putative alpha-1,2-mannosidase